MKNFCPKCGAHLKPGAEFCPKCGTKIKKNQPINNMAQQAEPTPQKLTVFQKYKAFIISMGAIIVVGLCAGIFFLVKQNGGGHLKTTSALVRKKAKKHPKNEKQDDGQSSSASSSTSSDYSPSEWMLMGYMAYARDNYKESRDADTTSELVDDVQEDIDDGDLKVEANSDNTYTLSNKFGSVDVIVGSDDVKVNSDHGDDSRNSKDDLKSTFSSYQDKIQEMTKHIENNGSSSDSDDKADKDDKDKKETASSKSDLPGDEGLFTVPSEMRGTWYGYVSSLEMNSSQAITETLGVHTESTGREKYELHLQPKDLSHSQDYVASKEGRQIIKEAEDKKILAVKTINTSDLKGFTSSGWLQISHFQTFYAPYTLKGQQVLLNGSGGQPMIRQILWKTPKLAKKYKNTKFPQIEALNKQLVQ